MVKYKENNWKIKLTIIFITTLVALSAVELFLHILDYPNLKKEDTLQRFRSSRLYHHFHAPDEYYIQRKQVDAKGNMAVDKILKFTSQGLRDLPKKNNLPKIIFIGDSFVEAFQVDINDMFGNLVEKELGNMDIINVGCSSWSSLNYYLWFKNNIYLLNKVKSVYLFFFPNDPYDTGRYLAASDNPNDYENISFNNYFNYRIRTGDEAEVPAWKRWVRRHIKIYLLISFAKKNAKSIFASKKDITTEGPFEKGQYTDWVDVFAGIKTERQKRFVEQDNLFIVKIKDFLTSRGIRFTLVYIPIPYQVGDDEALFGAKDYSKESLRIIANSNVFQEYLSELAKINKFDFLDLTPLLKDYKKNNPGVLLYNIQDGHFSTQGHKVVAESMINLIREKDRKESIN